MELGLSMAFSIALCPFMWLFYVVSLLVIYFFGTMSVGRGEDDDFGVLYYIVRVKIKAQSASYFLCLPPSS